MKKIKLLALLLVSVLSVLFVSSINATDMPLQKDSIKQQSKEREVLIKDTSIVEPCDTSVLPGYEDEKQAINTDICSQIIFLVLGAILGFVCSLAATALYNYLHKAKLSIDEYIAKVIEENNTRYSFLVVNERNADVINVEAEVAIVYYMNNKKFTDTIELTKTSTKCLAGKCTSNTEDSTYVFTIKNTKDFEDRWTTCQKEDDKYEDPIIRLRVVAYHAQSGLASFIQKEFTQNKIQEGMFKDRKFIATNNN